MGTYTFKGSKVTITTFGIGQEFSYKIEDGQLKIMQGGMSLDQSFEKDGDDILIGGGRYVKE